MSREKVVLAYSGGLDTSVAIAWLREKYDLDVIAVVLNIGQPENLQQVQRKALRVGAVESIIADADQEFVDDFVVPAVQANSMYEKKYPLSTSLSRPLIAKVLVEAARKHGATAIAHGCTAKGNDQVRIEAGIMSLAPDLKIIAPQREWVMSREEEIEYAEQHSIDVPVTKSSPYSVDENIWGRSVEAGVLEDPNVEPPPDAFKWTVDPTEAPDTPEYLEIGFIEGVPVSLNEAESGPATIIPLINKIAGAHGVGRIDMVENRVIGIKSREIYECPAATVILAAHRELESLVLTRDLLHYKYLIEEAFAQQVYYGLWFSPLRQALSAFIHKSQEKVTGLVRLKLFKGSYQVVGRQSHFSLYDHGLATYDSSDQFSHESAKGFIELWALPYKVWASKQHPDQSAKAGESE